MMAPSIVRSLSACIVLIVTAACAGTFSVGSTATRLGEPPAGSRTSARMVPAGATNVYVSSRNNAQILAFPVGGNGNIAPAFSITGAKTMLTQPVALALSSKGKIYAANDSANELLIFASGAHGNATPTVLGGSKVPINRTAAIALDASDNIYVSDYGAKQILVFAAGSTGNTAPIRTIKGSKTQITTPMGIALDGSGDLFLVNFQYPSSGNGIVEFAPGANGNVAPIAQIGGSKTMLVEPESVSIDSTGRIVVPSNSAEILIFSKGSNGNVAPAVVISGSKTMLGGAGTAGVNPSDAIYVSQCCLGGGNVLVFASTAKGNVKPIRTIAGSKTQLDDPFYPSFH